MEQTIIIQQIINALNKRYEEVTFLIEYEEQKGTFYFLVRNGDIRMEVYTKLITTNIVELWYLDDFGADNENPGDWVYTDTFAVLVAA